MPAARVESLCSHANALRVEDRFFPLEGEIHGPALDID
jgi:hypothetical protein